LSGDPYKIHKYTVWVELRVLVLNVVVNILTSRLEWVLTSISKIKLYVNKVTICKTAATHRAYCVANSNTMRMNEARWKALNRNKIGTLHWLVDTSTNYTGL
jgi:hypothetical protein